MLTNMEHQGSYHTQNIQTYNDERKPKHQH
jgi:hypothetical protein